MTLVNLFMIEAPFQFVSATQAARSTVLGSNILLIRLTGRERNDAQVLSLLNKSGYQWKRILFIDTTNFLKLAYQLLMLKATLLFENKNVNVLAFGDFYSYFSRFFYKLFSYNELWFLDDGIASLNLYRSKGKGLEVKPEHLQSKKVRSYFRKANNFKSKTIILKTFLNINSMKPFVVDNIDLMDAFLAEKLPDQSKDNKVVYFLGAKLVEAGFLNRIEYWSICERVAQKFSNKKVIYLPHRQESECSVNEISEHFDFDVLRPSLPVEFYLCQLKSIPGEVISICSAALCTIPEVFPEIHVSVINFERSSMNEIDKAGFDLCYQYLAILDKVTLIP